jgi:hypothetical protein
MHFILLRNYISNTN